MKVTCQSEVGTLKRVYVKQAKEAFISEDVLELQWKGLHFLEKPRFADAVREFQTFEEILRRTGATVHHFPQHGDVTIDSLYCRDASIVTDHGIVLCNMGKASRRGEPEAQRITFLENEIRVLGQIREPGTLEGGDCVWLDNKTLAVGETYRTNSEGIKQLYELLAPYEIRVLVVSLPHYKGPNDVFHLMSIFSPLDDDLAVVYSPLMPIGFRKELLQRGFVLVEVPDKEFESMGCNVLALSPRRCVILKGNPRTKEMLEKSGCEVFEYEGREISLKGGGGPTCLTRPIERLV